MKKASWATSVNKPSSAPSSVAQAPQTTSSASYAAASASVVQGGGGDQTNGPELTITLINQYGKAISTGHVDNNAGIAATGVNGSPVTSATMAPGATAVFAVPTGWGGNVAIADAEFELGDNDSLLEASYGNQGSAGLQTDLDVSYVNGFSVPIICKCMDKTQNTFRQVTGSNVDLFSAGGCTDTSGTGSCGLCHQLDGNGACINPNRSAGALDATVVTDEFFMPAAGGAYTFPFDGYNGNNGNSKCSGAVTCCVGTSCN